MGVVALFLANNSHNTHTDDFHGGQVVVQGLIMLHAKQ